MTLALVMAGAAVGAVLRYVCDRAIQRWRGSVFPWGTMAVNVVGCLLLGIVSETITGDRSTALLGAGFCGAFTTYSTFAYETASLTRAGSWPPALVNIVTSVILGVGALVLGVAIGARID